MKTAFLIHRLQPHRGPPSPSFELQAPSSDLRPPKARHRLLPCAICLLPSALLLLCTVHAQSPPIPLPPVITEQPQGTNVAAGQTVTLSVGVGPSILTTRYQWQHSPSTNPAPTWSPLTGATNRVLTLPEVQLIDARFYRALVSNAMGQRESTAARVGVLEVEAVGLVRPSVSWGANVSLRGLLRNVESAESEWFFDGLPLGQQGLRLLLTNVTAATHAGTYRCAVTSPSGGPVSAELTLQVDETFTQITTGPVVTTAANNRGGAWVDLDGDDDLDLATFSFRGRLMIYLNQGEGTFVRATAQDIGSVPGTSVYAALWGDYDNTNGLDLYIASNEGILDEVYRNNGLGRLTRMTRSEVGPLAAQVASSRGSWFDYDNDGWLDLLVQPPGLGALWHNEANGTFTSITNNALATTTGFRVSCADYDNDGWVDVLMHRLAAPPEVRLYHNEGQGNFSRVTNTPLTELLSDTVAGVWGDYDNDGDLDLFLPNWTAAGTNHLFRNSGGGLFVPITEGPLVQPATWSWTASWVDYDNDGFLDLHIARAGGPGTADDWGPSLPSVLYHNDGPGPDGTYTFTEITAGSLVNELQLGLASSWGDYDSDGFMDLFIATAADAANRNGYPDLLYHTTPNANRWLIVKLLGTASNRSGVGAKVRVQAFYAGQDRWQLRQIWGGDGWGNNAPLYAHFGLGNATKVNTLKIEWPSGITQEFLNVRPREIVTIEEPAATLTVSPQDVEPGQSVTFEASTPPGASVQWRRNGENIPGATAATLVITNAQLADVGDYTVAIRGLDATVNLAFTATSKPVHFELAGKPTVGTPTVVPAASVSLGENVTISVSASGAPPLSYQWRRNGVDLAPSEYPTVTNSSLVISNVQQSAQGDYSVVVFNDRGSAPSPAVFLQVDPTFITITAGDNVTDHSLPFMGSWVDLDNDGFLDLAVGAHSALGPLVLYRNNGDGTSSRVPATAATTLTGTGFADFAWADLDNDGWLDGWLGIVGANDVILFNRGNWEFDRIDVTPSWIANGVEVPSFNVAIGDYDQDGLTDIGLSDWIAQRYGLLHNLGNRQFAAVTNTPITLARVPVEAISWVDYDSDGDLDLLGLNDGSVSTFRNDGNGQFSRVAARGLSGASGIFWTWADYDNDGNLDCFLVTTNSYPQPSGRLYRNLGGGQFTRLTEGPVANAGNTNGFLNGAAWGDYDNDGYLDLAAVGGITAGWGLPYVAQPGLLYHNNGDGTFTRITTGSFVNELILGGLPVWGDYDNDGFLDLYVPDDGGSGQLYRNGGNTNHWLKVSLVGNISNRPAIGAKVRALSTLNPNRNPNPTWQMREIASSGGWAGGMGLIAHFGLGDATSVTTLRIEWPSGIVQELANTGVNTNLTVTEPNFRFTPEAPSVSLNGDVKLMPTVTGDAYQWQFNGADLPGQTNRSLSLSNVVATQAGLYAVHVTTGVGTWSRGVQLTIDPTFTKITSGDIVTDRALAMSGSWGDADNDGFLDLTLACKQDKGLLYRNNRDGTFTKVPLGPGLYWAGGWDCLWADLDNNDTLDLWVARFQFDDVLFFNRGDWNFDGVIVTPSWIANGVAEPAWYVAAADYDQDGYVDLALADWTFPNQPATACSLLRNLGNGQFIAVTNSAIAQTRVNAESLNWADYDSDGDPDLLVIADGLNVLFRNDGNGEFVKATPQVIARAPSGLSGAWSDYDNDGDLDLYYVPYTTGISTNRLYRNEGGGVLTPITQGPVATTGGHLTFGAWGDYDNDGYLDLAVTGGNGEMHGYPAPVQPGLLFHNNGDGSFTQITTGSFVNERVAGAAPLWGDYDNDGFLDLYVACHDEPGRLYRNIGSTNHWLKVSLVGKSSNRSAIGAKVRVLATLNPNLNPNPTPTPTWQMREIASSGGWACGSGLVAHFGLGQATNVDLLRIEWPSGIVQEMRDVAPKQFLTITEPDIWVTPRIVEFVGGTNVMFTVATSLPSPTFQWQFKGTELADQTGATLTVENLQAVHAGRYTVVIQSPGTTEALSGSATILPAIPPKLTRQPQSQTVDPGTDVTLEVTASGSPPLIYQWLVNGQPLPWATNASVVVTNLQPDRTGEYVVEVRNAGGTVVSAPALVTLVGGATIAVQPADLSVSQGATATFSVVPDGTPPFSYQWRRNGAIVFGATAQTLSLPNAQLTDSGAKFTVEVVNALGRMTSREALLEVDPTFAKVTTGGLADAPGHYHGQAWGDYDNDGDPDLLMLGLEPAQDVIFRNNGDGSFAKIHPSPWERTPNPFVWAYGWGDYDNDGYLDLFFGDTSPYGDNPTPSVLLRNNGAGGFASIGLAGGVGHFSAAWADYDRDGWLDFAAAGWGLSSRFGMIESYRNQGGHAFSPGAFNELSVEGSYVAPAWVDLDSDGWLDLFVTQYATNNAVFLNLGQGTSSKLTESDLVNDPAKWVASAWGDYDNDGDLDAFVTAAEDQPNALYRNDGQRVFQKMTAAEVGSLVVDAGSSWGCAWGDYDNDGWLDLFVANGNRQAQRNFLYHNNGDGTFTRITRGSLANDLAESISCNWVDYDQDGFLDLFVQNHAWPEAAGVVAPNFLYRNSGNSNRWLAIKCLGTASPRWGTGAKVRVLSTLDPDRNPTPTWQMRVIDVGGTWFGGLSFVAHFGLGDAPVAETVRIEWPSGAVEELSQVAPNRYLTVTETVLSIVANTVEPWPGQSVTLRVATPLPGASYQWYRNGQAIPGATGIALELTDVGAADMGEYTVAVTRFDSGLGAQVATVSLPIRLQLATKPEVDAPVFEPESVSLGAEVSVQAAVSGTAPFSCQWQFNGVDLATNPTATTPTLRLTNVQASAVGLYRLVVSNALGRTVGPEARLEVDPTFTKITAEPLVTEAMSTFGRSWMDYDADGDLDLLISNPEWPAGQLPFLTLVIYRNEGAGVFTRLSQSFPDVVPIAFYLSCADYDNDGYPDVFLSCWSQYLGIPANNILLHNERNGAFRHVTTAVPAEEGGISTEAAWADYNRDGWLDLFVANSLMFSAPLTNWMYLNQGNGDFVKLTADQVGPPLQDVGVWTLPSWADVDDDGWQDLLVKNSGGANHLYHNTGTGSFVSVGTGPLVTETATWHHSTWVDYDNDGDLDLFFVDSFITNHVLLRNEGGWGFRKMTEAEVGPLVADGAGRGAAWGDYDNDGNLDIFIAKGIFSPDKSSCFRTNGEGTFTRVTTGSPVHDRSYGDACDWVDYDQDGALDLFVFDQSLGPYEPRQQRLYHNNGNTNHWLVVKCVGAGPPFSPRSATGAKVRTLATIGGKPVRQLRLIDAGGTAQAGQSWYAHFGLGDATNVTTLRIEWPSGIVQELSNVPANQLLTVVEARPAPVLSRPLLRGDGVFQFTVLSGAGKTNVVEMSEDLRVWTSVVTNTGPTTLVEIPAGLTSGGRFFRARE